MINRCYFFFFKQKTAYEMRISDWSSDVCSSDLFSVPAIAQQLDAAAAAEAPAPSSAAKPAADSDDSKIAEIVVTAQRREEKLQEVPIAVTAMDAKQIETRGIQNVGDLSALAPRSEEHTSELQSLMRISYAVFCLKKKKM